jgi:hypothetical protein
VARATRQDHHSNHPDKAPAEAACSLR